MVNENGKQRFSMVYQRVGDQEGWWIRANQGHSLPVPELELRTISSVEEAPSMVIHGTDLSFWPSIRRDGLKAMGRNHIHMASGMPGHEGVISGMRSRCSLFIHLDISRVLQGKGLIQIRGRFTLFVSQSFSPLTHFLILPLQTVFLCMSQPTVSSFPPAKGTQKLFPPPTSPPWWTRMVRCIGRMGKQF